MGFNKAKFEVVPLGRKKQRHHAMPGVPSWKGALQTRGWNSNGLQSRGGAELGKRKGFCRGSPCCSEEEDSTKRNCPDEQGRRTSDNRRGEG